MSQDVAVSYPVVKAQSPKTFVGQAQLIGAITFFSRLLGMARESIAANYFVSFGLIPGCR